MFLAGCVGFYPPAMAKIDDGCIQAQYLQVKDSINKILGAAIKGSKLQPTWQ